MKVIQRQIKAIKKFDEEKTVTMGDNNGISPFVAQKPQKLRSAQKSRHSKLWKKSDGKWKRKDPFTEKTKHKTELNLLST